MLYIPIERAVDCKTVGFFSQNQFSASFQTFCLTSRAYLNTQKYGLFCSLSALDCKTVGFFLKISKEIGKGWRKSLTREAREPHTPVGRHSFTERQYNNTLTVAGHDKIPMWSVKESIIIFRRL